MGDALRPQQGGFTLLLHEPDLTVLHVVWAPGMRIYPHDHRMWATIGIYAGREDNAFYRRATDDRSTLVESGGKQLGVGDVVTLGDDTIHSVANTSGVLTAAIHVYGGDFVNEPRSQWGPGPERERPSSTRPSRSSPSPAAWLDRTLHEVIFIQLNDPPEPAEKRPAKRGVGVARRRVRLGGRAALRTAREADDLVDLLVKADR